MGYCYFILGSFASTLVEMSHYILQTLNMSRSQQDLSAGHLPSRKQWDSDLQRLSNLPLVTQTIHTRI